MADHIDVAKEIVLKMIEHGKIHLPHISDRSDYGVEANQKYTQEVCKAFKTVYQTVQDAWNNK